VVRFESQGSEFSLQAAVSQHQLKLDELWTACVPFACALACYSCVLMLKQIFGAVWRHLPPWARNRLTRIGQKRFTVTTAVAIFDDQGRVLLLEHVFRPDSGWGLPGGFLSSGEQPEAGVRREIREEVGIELEEVELVFVRTLGRLRQVEIYFRAKASGIPQPRSFEIKRAAWFARNALPPDLSKDQIRLIDQAVSLSEKS
jgi:ADP-ribose pyrophosphatase YjhB (NUDIX family)